MNHYFSGVLSIFQWLLRENPDFLYSPDHLHTSDYFYPSDHLYHYATACTEWSASIIDSTISIDLRHICVITQYSLRQVNLL